jgi:hypothetical protein
MADQGTRKPWGAGRVVFFAKLEAIKAELSQGYPLTTIYDRHQAALQIGYRSFCKLVSRYADDAKLSPRRSPSSTEVSSTGTAGLVRPSVAVIGPPPPHPSGSAENRPRALRESAATPTFQHHGVVQEGEPERLFGAGFLPKRGA